MKLPTGYKQTEKLQQLIEESDIILITSHYSPDPDALSSSLATYLLLKNKYPKKEIIINIEGGIPSNLAFLHGYDEIKNIKNKDIIKQYHPYLIIMTDGKDMSRATSNYNPLAKLIDKEGPCIAAIDHHNELSEEPDIVINNLRASAAEEVYNVFVKKLDYNWDLKIGETILQGIIGDTNRFFWKNPNFRKTVNDTADIIEAGLHIEDLEMKSTTRFSNYQMDIMAELCDNATIKDNYNYTYVSDKLIESLEKLHLSYESFSHMYHQWMELYLRALGGNQWGFIIFKVFGTKNLYKGSFRAVAGKIDVSVFARELNGGGHKPAAGFGDIRANSIEEAIKIVENVIEQKYDEAIESVKED